MENLEKLEVNAEGKSLIARLKEEVVKGREANNSAIEVGMSGNTKEASAKFAELTTIVQSYIGAAEDVVRYNEGRVEFRYKEAKESATIARIIFVALGFVNLIIGILFSLTITKSIALPILRSSSHIDLMAKGDSRFLFLKAP
jgi:hypothetical protein